jgi:hypothetical protein
MREAMLLFCAVSTSPRNLEPWTKDDKGTKLRKIWVPVMAGGYQQRVCMINNEK